MAHEEIYRELAECFETREFVSYHKWGDDPSIFLVGVVEDLSPTRVVFQSVTTNGEYKSPLHAVPLRLIHSLDRRTLYLRRLRTLYDLGVSGSGEEREVRKPAEVRALLEEAARETFIVRVWTAVDEANDYLVSSVGDEVAVLESVIDGGPVDGRSSIRLKRIVRARVGRAERDDTRVHRHWKQHGFPSSRGGELLGL